MCPLAPSFPTEGGRIAVQLFANAIPGMSEISYVDGFIKLNDGFKLSPRRDFLLRVRGVALHELGKVSLVANAKNDRSAFYLAENHDTLKSDSMKYETSKNISESQESKNY